MKAKRGHDEQYLDLTGEAATGFRLILRQSRINGLDFSIILAVLVPQTTQVFGCAATTAGVTNTPTRSRTRRSTTFTFHFATERYQELGAREDGYARPTDRYGTFQDALDCLFMDANVSVPPKAQGELFDPVGG